MRTGAQTSAMQMLDGSERGIATDALIGSCHVGGRVWSGLRRWGDVEWRVAELCGVELPRVAGAK